MIYALIASRTATLIAIMIRKNFPIVLPPADPNAKLQEWFSGERTGAREGPAIEAGPSEVKV